MRSSSMGPPWGIDPMTYYTTFYSYLFALVYFTQEYIIPLDLRSCGICRKKEGNVLFNGALNTFYLRLYGIGHMVKDNADSEKGDLLPPHGLPFLISSKFFLYDHPRQDNTNHCLCYTCHGALTGTRNSSMGSTPWRIDPTTHRTMSERSYLGARWYNHSCAK